MIRNLLIRNKTTKQTQLNRILWEADSLLVNSRNSQPFYGKLMFIIVFTTGPPDLTIGSKWQTICIVFGRFPVWIADEHNESWKEMQVFLDVTPCWLVSGYQSVGRDVLEDVRASTTQLQGPEILAQYPEWVSRVVLTFFRHMAPVSRSIPSTGFSGHYSQIIVALKAVEAGLTVFSHVLKPKIKKRNITHTHTMSSVVFVIIIVTIIISIFVNQTQAAQCFFRNLSTTSQHFMGFKLNHLSLIRTRHSSPFSAN